jgi:hypothetical protein
MPKECTDDLTVAIFTFLVRRSLKVKNKRPEDLTIFFNPSYTYSTREAKAMEWPEVERPLEGGRRAVGTTLWP